MNEWISVKDKEFPKNGKFLAINKELDQAVVYYDYAYEYLVRGRWFGFCEYGCGGYDTFENITHWMPLPNPPLK